MDGRTLRLSLKVLHFIPLCVAAITWADSTTLIPSQDNSIFQSNPKNSLGGGQGILIGNNALSSPRRGLLQFDIANSIPAGSAIQAVQLKLFLNQAANTGVSPTIRLYRLANDWGEGIAGNNTTGVTQIGQGFAADDGDATWNARHYSATTPTLWSTPGGDFSAIDSAALTITGTTPNTPFTWTSTPALVADVQSFLDDPANNSGWLLKTDDETTASSVRSFWSRESARTGQGAFSPQLLVTYTPVPEPACAILMLASALLARRRRK